MPSPIVNTDELIDAQDVKRTLPWIHFWACAPMLGDGYDLLSIANAAPAIIMEWGLKKHDVAVVLSLSAGSAMRGGITFSGGQTQMYATGGLIDPTAIRANGIGLGLFVTRSAGVVGPFITARLYVGDHSVQQVLWVAALPPAVVSICYVMLSRRHRQARALSN